MHTTHTLAIGIRRASEMAEVEEAVQAYMLMPSLSLTLYGI